MTDASRQQSEIQLHVVNRGFNRALASGALSNGLPETDIPHHVIEDYAETLTRTLPPVNPWTHLLWWESPWQARIGIEALCSEPFLHLSGMNYTEAFVPTRFLYPYALQRHQTERIGQAATAVSALVRQARELYAAAAAGDVTDLSRPILYFYGALALAKAVTITLFGVERIQEQHGLGHRPGPTIEHPVGASWPTLITWQSKGVFPMFMRATRWDELYRCCAAHSPWKTLNINGGPPFHVLECIRWLWLDWGTLPPTGFELPPNMLAGRSHREHLLLMYGAGDHPYMTQQTPLDNPAVEAPRVAVQYMLLYYFSILARYHPVAWQELLAGVGEPEGYVFRVALQQVAYDYLQEMIFLLPRPSGPDRTIPTEWHVSESLLKDWYRHPVVQVGGPTLPMLRTYPWEEWTGDPGRTCPSD